MWNRGDPGQGSTCPGGHDRHFRGLLRDIEKGVICVIGADFVEWKLSAIRDRPLVCIFENTFMVQGGFRKTRELARNGNRFVGADLSEDSSGVCRHDRRTVAEPVGGTSED